MGTLDITFRAARIALLAAMLPVAGRAQIVSVSFQQGVDGYLGAKSVLISDYQFSPTLGTFGDNGTTFANPSGDFLFGKLSSHPSYGYDLTMLMRFENLTVPNAPLTAASLTVFLSTDTPGAKVVGRYMNRYWFGDQLEDSTDARVGWRFRDRATNFQWTAFGARSEGNDFVALKQFLVPGDGTTLIADLQMRAYTTSLDIAIVQGWLAFSATNFGVKLDVDVPGVGVFLVEPQRTFTESRPLSMRPRLTLTFGRPALFISRTNNLTRLAWQANAGAFVLQQASSVLGPYTNSPLPTSLEGTNRVAYDGALSGPNGRYYRLKLAP
jgi:hypothetical protein